MNRFKTLIYLLGLIVLFSACSKDDEGVTPKDELENVQIGLFGEDAREIAVPEAMQQSEDPYAMTAQAYILQATLMPSLYGSMFLMPSEYVEKRSSPIISSTNARIAANDYWVYEWGTDTASIAYQFYEEGNQQFFELFINTGGKGYFKWMEIVQNKDGKKGTMRWFDDESSENSLIWTWETRADESYLFTFRSYEDDYRYEIVSNKDLSGSIKSYEGSNLEMQIEWNSDGNGFWQEYEGGDLVDQGEWAA